MTRVLLVSPRSGARALLMCLAVSWPAVSHGAGDTRQLSPTRQITYWGKSKIPLFRSDVPRGYEGPDSRKYEQQISQQYRLNAASGSVRFGDGMLGQRPPEMSSADLEKLLGKRVGPTKFTLDVRHPREKGLGYLIFDRCYVNGEDNAAGFWASYLQADIDKPVITISLSVPPGQYVMTLHLSPSSSDQATLLGPFDTWYQTYIFTIGQNPIPFAFESKGGTANFFLTFSSSRETGYGWNENFFGCEVKPLM